jgi:2-hydroxychromene-2-carboxylate isomerase
MKTVDFYYDFSCPFAYIGSTQIATICERHGAQLELRPVLLGGVFRHWETPQAPSGGMPAPKARHNVQDMHRWARYYNTPFELPARHPMRTVEALRMLLVSPKAHWWGLTCAIYRAYWVDGRDITDRGVLAAIAGEQGLQTDQLLEQLDDPAVKAELRERTEEAIGRGVFGVPTFFIDDEQYWGQDRLDFVERAIS